MKKLLFTLAITLMLVFCLGLVASAETITYEGQEITVERWFTAEQLIQDYENGVTGEKTLSDLASKLNNSVSDQKKILDDNSIVVVADSLGDLYAFPSYYILYLISGGEQVSETDYDFLNAYSGKSFSRGAVRYIAFPEGLTIMRNNGVWGRGTHYEVNTTEIVIPKSTKIIANKAFNANTTIKKVYIKEGNAITEIQDYAFEGCTSLEYFEFEKLTELTAIDGFAASPKLTGDLDLTKNKNLKTIGNNAFYSTNFGKICLPDSVESIGSKAFLGPNFYFASPYLPSSLTSVGNEFLSGTKNLNELLVFPEGVTRIDDEGFSGCYLADTSKTFTIVFLGKMTRVYIDGHSYTNWAAQTNVYFAQNSLSDVQANVYAYADKETGALGSIIADNKETGTLDLDIATNSPQSTTQVGSNFIRLIFCAEDGEVEVSHVLTNEGNDITEDRGNFDMAGHISADIHEYYTQTLVSEANCGYDGIFRITCIVCEKENDKITPATGEHIYTPDNTCETEEICTICEKVVEEAKSHTLLTEIAYIDGFMSAGVKCVTCENDNCTIANNETVVKAIFKSLGYSASERQIGSYAIMQGFVVDRELLAEYNQVNSDKQIKEFGLLAGTKLALGEKTTDVFDSTGATNEYKLGTVKFTETAHTVFEIKIIGLENSKNDLIFEELEIYCCGFYLLESESGLDSYYLDETGESEVLPSTVSYKALAPVQ